MIASIGVAASPKANELPESITNCTIDVSLLDSASLQHSVFIFSGIFIAGHLIAIVYHVTMLILRCRDVSAIDLTSKIFKTIDYIINIFLMMLFIGSMMGSYMIGWLWSSYASATSEQSDNNTDTILSALMYLAFVS